MKSLLLSGYGIGMKVDNGRLHIHNGNDRDREPEDYVFKPKFIDYDNIVIYGHTGTITLDAIRWLTKQNVQITMLDWNGNLLTTMEPQISKQSETRMAQYRAYNDKNERLDLAHHFITAKIQGQMQVLRWLADRYPEVEQNLTRDFKDIREECHDVEQADSIRGVMGVEGIFAQRYWNILTELFDEKWEFTGRCNKHRNKPIGAVDPLNALFNYGYAVLETICRNAIHSNGMDINVGFLHSMNPSKTPLVYDMQEPFRWLVDVAIIGGLENKVFNNKDFLLTENYNIRIKTPGVKKLLDLLTTQFSHTVRYKNHSREWKTIIHEKSRELAHYLTHRRKRIDFSQPQPHLQRIDTHRLREQILNMSYTEWKNMGYSKGTLHYMKQNAQQQKPFKVYKRAQKKLEGILNSY